MASAHYKNLDSRARLFKKTRHPAATKMIIETFQEYFSISSFGETPSEFLQCIGFAQIVQTLCDSRAR